MRTANAVRSGVCDLSIRSSDAFLTDVSRTQAHVWPTPAQVPERAPGDAAHGGRTPAPRAQLGSVPRGLAVGGAWVCAAQAAVGGR